MTRREFVGRSVAAGLLLSGVPAAGFAALPARPGGRREGGPRLWYDRPAHGWVEALPVGNGRLGAMVFGGVARERLQLNEDTLWSGGPREWNNPGAPEALGEVRRLIAEGRYVEADAASQGMMGPYTQSYLPLGDLRLTFEHGEPRSDYRRELDLRTAVTTVSYRIGGVRYTREVFASHPAQVLVVRLAADRAGRLSFRAALDSELRHRTAGEHGVLKLSGRAPTHVEPSYRDHPMPVVYAEDGGMAFEAWLGGSAVGGRLWVDHDGLHVRDADEVVLVLSAATSFAGFDRSPADGAVDPAAAVGRRLAAALEQPYAGLRDAHVADHGALFDRVELRLDVPAEADDLPTDERIAARGAADPRLVELLFQYGRYLLVASSRPGTQPANLQGIWNEDVRPPWSSNYTININAQMNYWPAEVTNLAELHEPLLRMIAELAQNGTETARVNYGARGWVAHHNTDLWRQSAPVGDFGEGDPVWALWMGGAAWLALHLWEHYAFGLDERYLRQHAYPLMRSAAEFYLDWLVEDANGHLLTSPSTSPELRFAVGGGHAAVSAGATMDIALIRDLFVNTRDAARILDVDAGLRQRLDATIARLLPYRIGSRGQLQEWAEDWPEQDPQHRHFSHLFGVHPGRDITPESTPDLVAAARRSMELRGDEATGWSMGWKINFWARMRDGDRALRLLGNLLRPARDTPEGGGVYPNLLDAHPPFQIDGNFGATAGIAEMLLQSHDGEIHLLPALPAAWNAGLVRGLRARGGFTADLEWAHGRLTRASLLPLRDAPLRVRYASRVRSYDARAGRAIVITG